MIHYLLKKNRTVRYELKFNHNKHTRMCSMIIFFFLLKMTSDKRKTSSAKSFELK